MVTVQKIRAGIRGRLPHSMCWGLVPFSLQLVTWKKPVGIVKKIFFLLNLFIYLFWLCWVFVSVRGLSLVAASRGHSSSQCAGLSLSWSLLLRSTGSRRAGSVVVAHRPSCSAACGIFPDQGSNPCPLHWQADSQPLRHQGSPVKILFSLITIIIPLKLYKVHSMLKSGGAGERRRGSQFGLESDALLNAPLHSQGDSW